MNQKIILTLLLFAFCSSCKSLKTPIEIETDPYFQIEIVQKDNVIPVKGQTVTLEKKPFFFRVRFFKTDHVYVSASWGKYYYDYPHDKSIFECNDTDWFEGCRFVAIKTGTQDHFNINKDLSVGDGDYQQVWFYKPDTDWHRFDRGVEVKEGVTLATMTVENIYDCDKRDEGNYLSSEYDYPIKNISQDIYMVFATSKYTKEKTYELQREKFVIRFK